MLPRAGSWVASQVVKMFPKNIFSIKMAPSSQDASKMVQDGSNMVQDASKMAHDAAKMPQDASKMPQDASKMAQEHAKTNDFN